MKRPHPLLLVLAAILVVPMTAGVAGSDPLETARALVEAGQPAQALPILDALIKRKKPPAEAYLLRSTAAFLLGDHAAGEKDLLRTLELDNKQRQGWLNLGALRLSQADAAAALVAFEHAEALNPDAADNGINLGATQLLLGAKEAAASSFARYLKASAGAAEANVLVAKNYSVAGLDEQAMLHLETAFGIEENTRLQLRTDPVFERLRSFPPAQDLLATLQRTPNDRYRVAAQRYKEPYDLRTGRLIGAVIDALRNRGDSFDPRVETDPNWAMIWGDYRVKIAPADEGSILELSADRDRYSESRWIALTEAIFREISYELAPKLPG